MCFLVCIFLNQVYVLRAYSFQVCNFVIHMYNSFIKETFTLIVPIEVIPSTIDSLNGFHLFHRPSEASKELIH